MIKWHIPKIIDSITGPVDVGKAKHVSQFTEEDYTTLANQIIHIIEMLPRQSKGIVLSAFINRNFSGDTKKTLLQIFEARFPIQPPESTEDDT